jgi:hypothetical protein
MGRTLTPAVLASIVFAVACAVIAIAFVAARGGLQMPVAAAGSGTPAAPSRASMAPGSSPSASAGATVAPATPPATAGASAETTPPPSAAPTIVPPPTSGPPDPLAALPGCAAVPGCYEYTIKRGDSLTGVASRYAIDPSVVLALNPELTDPSTIVVGEILYLGRDPFLRLPPCAEASGCSLYAVLAGDRLSTIAGRFGITTAAILAANPAISDANAIHTGQVIRLPHPAA